MLVCHVHSNEEDPSEGPSVSGPSSGTGASESRFSARSSLAIFER